MTNEQKIKELTLRSELSDHIGADLPSGAKKFLLDEITTTPSGRAHVVGTAPAPSIGELVNEVWATEGGQRLRHILAQGAAQFDAQHATQRQRRIAEIEVEQDYEVLARLQKQFVDDDRADRI